MIAAHEPNRKLDRLKTFGEISLMVVLFMAGLAVLYVFLDIAYQMP